MSVENSETVTSTYMSLFKWGGAAAIIVAILTLIEVVFFVLYPQPSTVQEWFTLFQENKIIGLLDFWGFEIPMYLMFILVFLALYLSLNEINRGLMAVALTIALVGSGVFLATNNPFTMLTLSNKYAAATTELERTTILAVGESMLANTNQRAVGGFNLGLFLVSTAGLMFSIVMLQSDVFGRAIAYTGVVTFSLSLADYLRQALTSSLLVTLLVVIPNAILVVIWFVLVGRRLYQLGSGGIEPRNH